MNEEKRMTVTDLGLIPYPEAWQRQTLLFDEIIEAKKHGTPYQNHILLCEHPHVYTVGRSGKEANMLLTKERLESINASLHRVDRGGDITYHGPGQLVCYPVLDLEIFDLGLKTYIHLLEEAVISLCTRYGIACQRMEGATGVWLNALTAHARKICAIGVRSSRYVTMHGLALNVNTDLRYFDYINPCGFTDKGVTSLNYELKREVSMPEIKERLAAELTERLHTISAKSSSMLTNASEEAPLGG